MARERQSEGAVKAISPGRLQGNLELDLGGLTLPPTRLSRSSTPQALGAQAVAAAPPLVIPKERQTELSRALPTERIVSTLEMPAPSIFIEHLLYALTSRDNAFFRDGGVLVVAHDTAHSNLCDLSLLIPGNLGDPLSEEIYNGEYGVKFDHDFIFKRIEAVPGKIAAVCPIILESPTLNELCDFVSLRRKIWDHLPNAAVPLGMIGAESNSFHGLGFYNVMPDWSANTVAWGCELAASVLAELSQSTTKLFCLLEQSGWLKDFNDRQPVQDWLNKVLAGYAALTRDFVGQKLGTASEPEYLYKQLTEDFAVVLEQLHQSDAMDISARNLEILQERAARYIAYRTNEALARFVAEPLELFKQIKLERKSPHSLTAAAVNKTPQPLPIPEIPAPTIARIRSAHQDADPFKLRANPVTHEYSWTRSELGWLLIPADESSKPQFLPLEHDEYRAFKEHFISGNLPRVFVNPDQYTQGLLLVADSVHFGHAQELLYLQQQQAAAVKDCQLFIAAVLPAGEEDLYATAYRLNPKIPPAEASSAIAQCRCFFHDILSGAFEIAYLRNPRSNEYRFILELVNNLSLQEVQEFLDIVGDEAAHRIQKMDGDQLWAERLRQDIRTAAKSLIEQQSGVPDPTLHIALSAVVGRTLAAELFNRRLVKPGLFEICKITDRYGTARKILPIDANGQPLPFILDILTDRAIGDTLPPPSLRRLAVQLNLAPKVLRLFKPIAQELLNNPNADLESVISTQDLQKLTTRVREFEDLLSKHSSPLLKFDQILLALLAERAAREKFAAQAAYKPVGDSSLLRSVLERLLDTDYLEPAIRSGILKDLEACVFDSCGRKLQDLLADEKLFEMHLDHLTNAMCLLLDEKSQLFTREATRLAGQSRQSHSAIAKQFNLNKRRIKSEAPQRALELAALSQQYATAAQLTRELRLLLKPIDTASRIKKLLADENLLIAAAALEKAIPDFSQFSRDYGRATLEEVDGDPDEKCRLDRNAALRTDIPGAISLSEHYSVPVEIIVQSLIDLNRFEIKLAASDFKEIADLLSQKLPDGFTFTGFAVDPLGDEPAIQIHPSEGYIIINSDKADQVNRAELLLAAGHLLAQ